MIERADIERALQDVEALGDEQSIDEAGAFVARLRALGVEPFGAMETVLAWVREMDDDQHSTSQLAAAFLEGMAVGLHLARPTSATDS